MWQDVPKGVEQRIPLSEAVAFSERIMVAGEWS